MQSYKKACKCSQYVENRKPIHTGKLNISKRQEHILCCTMKGKSNITSIVQIGNLEICGIEERNRKGKYPVIQKGYDECSFDVEMHRNVGLLSEFN